MASRNKIESSSNLSQAVAKELLELPLDLKLEILGFCDLFSFINLLSTCRNFHAMWELSSMAAIYLRVLKNGMSVQAWLVYRTIRAIRWEAKRQDAISLLSESKPDGRITDRELPPHLRINFDKIDRRPDVGWPNADTILTPYVHLYGYGYIDTDENRYVLAADLFNLQLIARYRANQYIEAREELPVYNPRLWNLRMDPRHPDRFITAVFSHWFSELMSFEKLRVFYVGDYQGEYFTLGHAESWLDIAKNYRIKVLASDPHLRRHEEDINQHHEIDRHRIGEDHRERTSLPECFRNHCKCGSYRVYRLLDELFEQSTLSYRLDKDRPLFKRFRRNGRYWRTYVSKFPATSEFWEAVEDLTLEELDVEARRSFG